MGTHLQKDSQNFQNNKMASKIPSVWFKVAKSDAAPLIAAVAFAGAMGVGALIRTTLKHEDIMSLRDHAPTSSSVPPTPEERPFARTPLPEPKSTTHVQTHVQQSPNQSPKRGRFANEASLNPSSCKPSMEKK